MAGTMAADEGGLEKLRSKVAALENEREMRVKLEKLLEVQTVQVDLQKELRVKTESLLQAEQQTTSKLRQQIEEMHMSPGPETESRKKIEERLADAHQHIKKLELQMAESLAPETSDRMESQLRVQVEEKERLIARLTQQLESQAVPSVSAADGEPIRLQLLLQSRDKQLDELTQNMRKVQNDAAESQSEADVLKHQVRVMRKEVAEKSQEMNGQLKKQRDLQVQVFELQAKLEQLSNQYQEECRRSSEYAQSAAQAEESQLHVSQLEAKLAEEQTTSTAQRDQVLAEAEHRIQAKEQIIKHQTQTIASLNTELKERQEEINKLLRSGGDESTTPKADVAKEHGGLLPPLVPSPHGGQDIQNQRSLESLHRQLRAKDTKLAKKDDRIHTLTEMLEKRDKELDELQTARRDRETMRNRLNDLEEAQKAQPRATSHAEAERRLIEQETRMREFERKSQGMDVVLQQERSEKEALQRELEVVRGHVSEGASNAGGLQAENNRLSQELAEARHIIEGRTEELRRVRESRPLPKGEAPRPSTLPALQRRLQQIEDVDRDLGRDVAVWLQEKDVKIETLNSTITLLRSSIEDMRRGASGETPPAAGIPVDRSPQRGQSPEVVVPKVESAPDDRHLSPTPPSDRMPLGQATQPRRQQNAFSPPDLRGESPYISSPDLDGSSTEDIRQELLRRRQEHVKFESQMNEKQQLVMKLIEEANLCNAEVASLQQTVQQAYKQARKREKEFEKVCEEKDKFEKAAELAQRKLAEKDSSLSKMLAEHQQDTSGNAAVDELDRSVSWKLKMMVPRQHEIRHSMTLALKRRWTDDQSVIQQVDPDAAHIQQVDQLKLGLAHHFAVAASRIEIVLPQVETPSRPRSAESPDEQGYLDANLADLQGHQSSNDLAVLSITDEETDDKGQVIRSTVPALDILDHIRNDFLRGRRVNPVAEVEVGAIFMHHGDLVLPFEWPGMQARCLLREGRDLSGKHTVITVHEVRDPYILRIAAYETKQGQEYILFLNKRDVILVLDAHDGDVSQSSSGDLPTPPKYVHLEGSSSKQFQQTVSVADAHLLEVILNSLTFSSFYNHHTGTSHEILVATEMRMPAVVSQQLATVDDTEETLSTLNAHGRELKSSITTTAIEPYQRTGASQPMLLDDQTTHQTAVLPQVGVTRGLLPPKKESRRLFEDVIGFEGELCIFSLVHTTMSDFSQDILLATVYYPKKSTRVEACLHQPMLGDRLRIVAEVGQLDREGSLTVAIVVEEMIYPPSFLIRLTSISLNDVVSISPGEDSKPHSHVIRVAKDGSSALHIPDISFALSPSTMREKLLRCIGISSPIQGPRETLIMMGEVGSTKGEIIKRAVTGHVRAPYGLKVQLINSKKEMTDGDKAEKLSADMPAATRAKLRAKFGKGRLLVRHGRMLQVQGRGAEESVRAVVTIYERPLPYQHFLLCAYEPQTSREWEMLADSIDIFRLFTDNKERQETVSQALDLTNPATQEKLAEILVNCVQLAERNNELLLMVSPDTIRTFTEDNKKSLQSSDDTDTTAPEITVNTAGEPFDVKPAVGQVMTRALTAVSPDRGPDEEEMPIEQRTGDRLFTAERRFKFPNVDRPEAYKVQIYDSPIVSALHSYNIVASPVDTNFLAAAGLPVAILAGATTGTVSPVLEETPPHQRTFTLRVDGNVLKDFLQTDADKQLLEPTLQEQLLHALYRALYIQAEKDTGKLKLALRKQLSGSVVAQAREDPELMEELKQQGHLAPGMVPDSKNCREIGGQFPLNRLRIAGSGSHKTLAGPSLRGSYGEESGKIFAQGWKKVFCMAQRFGQATVMITISKRRFTYKLGVYEPETSALYEMLMETSASSTPLNVLIERCDLAGKLDLILCMHEVAFPHQICINLIHIPTAQEFNLKIGDDYVYTMIENSRREAFMIYLDQLLHWGVIGFDAAPGNEEQALANAYDETFAGNQIFDRTQVENLIEQAGTLSDTGEFQAPTALAPQPPKKIRVPVVRTQLEWGNPANRGNAPTTATITMSLLYHAEHSFVGVGQPTQTLTMRIHKRATNNDIALTFRMRTGELDLERSLPEIPDSLAPCSANGRPFETPALGVGEGTGNSSSEVTLWYVDKCSKVPCGAYGELIEVPGIDKPVLLLISDEDSPRAIRVCVTLASIPFTVLFQVVFLENSEGHAKVDAARSANRKVMQQTFLKYFGLNRAPTSAVLSQMSQVAATKRDMDLKAKLDEINSVDDLQIEHLGLEHGFGSGEPVSKARKGDTDNQKNVVDVNIVNMCTRQKMGRMMVFTLYRDMIAHNMYLRIVMHDPVANTEQHLTLLHYTTQRLLNILRINRDMIEETYTNMSDDSRRDGKKLKQELGKLIVDHLYLRRTGDPSVAGEIIDDVEFPEGEAVEYQLEMRDIMASATAADLTVKQKVLESAHDLFPDISELVQTIGANTPAAPASTHPESELHPMVARAQLAAQTESGPEVPNAPFPKTIIELTADNLVHKAEKRLNDRRLLVAFYNKTSAFDNVNYSHNIRIVVACVQSLNILCVQDFHEDKLEPLCRRRGKSHLMSATHESDLVRELCDCLAFEHVEQRVTGITFAGLDD